MAQQNYNAKMDETMKKLWEYVCDDQGWKNLKTSGDLSIHQKKSDVFDGILYKMERIVNASPQRLAELCLDFEFLKSSDKDLKNVEVIERLGGPDNLQIIRSVSDSALFGLVSAREFISMVSVRHHAEKRLYVLGHISVDHPKCPEEKKFVRGVIYPSGRFIYEVPGEPNKSRVVDFGQNDPKMSIPKMVIEQAVPGVFKAKVEHFDKALKKAGC
ncbi:stAR-related lipid transfer protein 5-like [Ptychodera flava]|uniref:stAR-related lipid transfer protein 5-like n=1 Tax=Ptychodera flava TaxID=63121 RepID=UPI00396A9EB0